MALTVWAQNYRPFISAEKLITTVMDNKKKKYVLIYPGNQQHSVDGLPTNITSKSLSSSVTVIMSWIFPQELQ